MPQYLTRISRTVYLKVCRQFHQHFARGFFLRKFRAQLFCTYILGLYFFSTRLPAQKMLFYCWFVGKIDTWQGYQELFSCKIVWDRQVTLWKIGCFFRSKNSTLNQLNQSTLDSFFSISFCGFKFLLQNQFFYWSSSWLGTWILSA